MADYLSPPLPCPPPHPCPLLFFSFQLLYFPHSLACKTGRIFLCVSLSGEWKQVQSASHLQGKKSEKLALPLPLFALQTQKELRLLF